MVVLLIAVMLAGCSERDLSDLAPAPANDDPVVFDDTFGSGVDYQAFMGSVVDAVSIDTDEARVGTASLRVEVPGPGGSDGTYAGGAFTTSDYRDLSGYDALSFYARSSVNSTLNEAGLGNDNTGTSLYTATRSAIPLTTDWSLVVIPIPDASRLALERGLFFFAEAHENNEGFTVWFDEVRFVTQGTITSPRPFMASRTVESFIGATIEPEGTGVTFSVNGEDVDVSHMPRYFEYMSSDDAVAVVEDGVITAVGGGTATISAKLDTIDVEGAITVNVLAPPADPAPAPTYAADDVIALFSDAYDEVPVDTWLTEWSMAAGVDDLAIGDDDVKIYTDLTFAGVEFSTETIDASAMTHVRVDVWAPSGTIFRLKLVDFGDDGVYNLPIDEWELTFHSLTDPSFEAGRWNVLDIPLSQFELDARAHLAQIVISSPDADTVFLDNVLFHR